MNLVVTNAFGTAVDVTALTVTVTGVTPAPGGACTEADFATLPASLPAPLRLRGARRAGRCWRWGSRAARGPP